MQRFIVTVPKFAFGGTWYQRGAVIQSDRDLAVEFRGQVKLHRGPDPAPSSLRAHNPNPPEMKAAFNHFFGQHVAAGVPAAHELALKRQAEIQQQKAQAEAAQKEQITAHAAKEAQVEKPILPTLPKVKEPSSASSDNRSSDGASNPGK